MKTKLLALVSFLLFFSSCTSVVGFVAGVPANYEGLTKQQLVKEAYKEYKLEKEDIILFDSIALDTFGIYPFKERWDRDTTSTGIQFAMYDSNNMLVSNYGICEGPRKRFGVWETFPPRNINPLRDTKLTFEEEVARWRAIDDSKINPVRFTSDYKLVVYWTTLSGAFGKRLVKQAKEYIKKYPDKDIQLILVNNDFIVN